MSAGTITRRAMTTNTTGMTDSTLTHDGLPLFNSYRKGLQLFVLHTRDGHAKGMIWAGSAEAARGRANSIVGSDSFVARANGSS
jgi:hypothetical protein